MNWLKSICLGRALIIAGFIAGYRSIGATIGHLGNDAFLLVQNSPAGPTHSWHHFLRELGGDFGAMAAILLIAFAAPIYRTPFNSAYGAPNMSAEINHLIMAIPPLIGCFQLRPHFRGGA